LSGGGALTFSPNGRWLLASSAREYRIWEVGSWKLTRQIPTEYELIESEHPADYSPDSKLLALVRELQIVQLLDAETGIELARLRAPEPSNILWVKFSPDGRRLVVAPRNHNVQVWDLPALRTQLASLDLNW
jgi:WD40 repeat protein